MKASRRSINIKSADLLQTSLSENNFTASVPIRTPTKNELLCILSMKYLSLFILDSSELFYLEVQ